MVGLYTEWFHLGFHNAKLRIYQTITENLNFTLKRSYPFVTLSIGYT